MSVTPTAQARQPSAQLRAQAGEKPAVDPNGECRTTFITGTLLPRSVADDLACVDAGRVLWTTAEGRAESVGRCAGRVAQHLGPASPRRSLLERGAAPLLVALGWHVHVEETLRERDHWVTPLSARGGRAAANLLVTEWAGDLGGLTRAAARSASAGHREWSILFNGTTLRLLDTRRPYAAAYLDVMTEALARHAPTRDAALRLWHPQSLGSPRHPGLLDKVVAAAGVHTSLTRAALEAGVHAALMAFGSALAAHACRLGTRRRFASRLAIAPGTRGAQGASAVPRAEPRPRHRAASDLAGPVFDEALTLVFRLLFLLFAEARGMVPIWHATFRESYALTRLCAVLHESWPDRIPRGLWATLRAIGQLAHTGCDVGTLKLVAFNGRLFEPSLTPLAQGARVADEVVGTALVALTTMPGATQRSARARVGVSRSAAPPPSSAMPARGMNGRRMIPFLDLGVEQLGSVYECVLDYVPRLDEATSRLVLERTREVRKASGSFYTPRSLTSFLVRRALAPLVEHAKPDSILGLRVLDPAMGSGAFLVEACRFLAAAIERAAQRHDRSRWDEAERTQVRRLVAQRCLFGVDVNPTATQLARLSLWLAGLSKDRPLSFLDQHLRVGNSLVGATIENLTQPPGRSTGRRPVDVRQLPLFTGPDLEVAVRSVVPRFRALSTKPDDTAEDVRAKTLDFAALTAAGGPLEGWRALADLWCASWFWEEGRRLADRGLYHELAAHCVRGRSTLSSAMAEDLVASGTRMARRVGAFHWWLEFPDVFFNETGLAHETPGFDAVVGNPPWEVLHRPGPHTSDGTSVSPANRDATRDEDSAWASRTPTVDVARLGRFVRESGQFPAADGHLNSYGLFVERILQLVRPGGRMGLVLPWGFVADHGVGRLRRHLFSSAHVDVLVGFDNRRAIFPIHRGMRFGLLTATLGAAPEPTSCALGLDDPTALDSVGDRGRVMGQSWWSLTPTFLARVGGERWAVPDVRDPIDVEVLDHVYGTSPALSSDVGWQARFGRELHASDDRRYFGGAPDALPVIEGKHIESFRLRTLEGLQRVGAQQAARLLPHRPFDYPRLAYRDVSSPTNQQVVVAAVLPAGVVSTHTLFCLRDRRSDEDTWCLCALLNSHVVGYLAALRISNHVTTAIVHELPVPRPPSSRARALLARQARRLATRDDCRRRMAADALCARAYGLSRRLYARVLACRVGEPRAVARHLRSFDRLALPSPTPCE